MNDPTIYIHSLAPWEKKVTEVKAVVTNLKTLKDLAVQKHLEAIKSAGHIPSFSSKSKDDNSTENLATLCNWLAGEFSTLNLGLVALQKTCEWGFSELIWRLEIQSEQMSELISLIKKPMETEANEIVSWGDDLYIQGRYKEAETEYLKSLKIYGYNTKAYLALGIIYLFNLIDKKRALHCFQMAEKNARGKSVYYTTYALMYQGLAHLDLGQFSEAEKVTDKALKENSELGIIFYQNAQYNALLGNHAKSVTRLREAAKFSVAYAIWACANPFFGNMKKELSAFLLELTDGINDKLLDKAVQIRDQIKNGNKIFSQLENPDLRVENVGQKILSLIEQRKFLDSLEAVMLLEQYCASRPVFEESKNALDRYISQCKDKLRAITKKTEDKRSNLARNITLPVMILYVIGVIVVFVWKIYGVDSWDLWAFVVVAIIVIVLGWIASCIGYALCYVTSIIGYCISYIFIRGGDKKKVEAEIARLSKVKNETWTIKEAIVEPIRIPGVEVVPPN